ncbi:MAG: hypothetical protein WBI85_08785 [Tepidanaerobacteraceae bacterium]
MDFLARDTVDFSSDFWKEIDSTVVDTVKKNLIGADSCPFMGL